MASLRLMIITGGSRGIGHFLVQMALREMDVLNISRQPAIVADDASRHQLHNLALDLEQVDLIEPVLSGVASGSVSSKLPPVTPVVPGPKNVTRCVSSLANVVV